ncbi:MAG: hypothetical protein JWQ12_1153 [Glaciihabitans sp.]|nr:hypothetical protein [Glaciihabitans sp.]
MRHVWKTADEILGAVDVPASTLQNRLASTHFFAICTLIRRETDLCVNPAGAHNKY